MSVRTRRGPMVWRRNRPGRRKRSQCDRTCPWCARNRTHRFRPTREGIVE